MGGNAYNKNSVMTTPASSVPASLAHHHKEPGRQHTGSYSPDDALGAPTVSIPSKPTPRRHNAGRSVFCFVVLFTVFP